MSLNLPAGRTLHSGRRQRGATLIELMIGLTVGLFVLAGAISMFASTSRSGGDNLRQTRLNQEARAIIDLMVQDIRRAGYSGLMPGRDYTTTAARTNPASAGYGTPDGVIDNIDHGYNPFTAAYDLVVGASGGEAANSCVVFSYNLDALDDADEFLDDGTPGTPLVGAGGGPAYADSDNNELFGFRLNDETIQPRSSGNTLSCGSGTWETVTDPTTRVTNLQFDTIRYQTIDLNNPNNTCPAVAGSACLEIRTLGIDLTLETGTAPAISRVTMQDVVRVRNDRFYYVP